MKKKLSITIEAEKYYPIPIVAKFLGYTSRNGVCYLMKSGKIPKKYIQERKTGITSKKTILGQRILGAKK